MPGILSQPIDRRRFLDISAKGLAAFVLSPAFSAPGAEQESYRVALLSDTHIAANPLDEYRSFLPTENLKKVMPGVLSARPEGVIINGDVARMSGELGDYEAIRHLVGPMVAQAPVYLVLGNHDDRTNVGKIIERSSAAVPEVKDKHVLVIEQPVVRLILLDSLLYPAKTPGFLGKGQRQWLADFLERSDARPTMLFVHHTLRDGDGDLLDADRLFEVIKPHRKVKAIFFGHSHEYTYGRHQGVDLVNLPAVGYNFNDEQPVGWVDATFGPNGVNLTLRAVGGNRSADGQVSRLSWSG